MYVCMFVCVCVCVCVCMCLSVTLTFHSYSLTKFNDFSLLSFLSNYITIGHSRQKLWPKNLIFGQILVTFDLEL